MIVIWGAADKEDTESRPWKVKKGWRRFPYICILFAERSKNQKEDDPFGYRWMDEQDHGYWRCKVDVMLTLILRLQVTKPRRMVAVIEHGEGFRVKLFPGNAGIS